MSDIDERIVSMKFDNKSFASGVKDTLSALAELKAGLNFDGSKRSIAELSSIANGVKLDSIGDQVENIGSKFEGLKAIALGAMISIGSKAVDLAVDMAKSFGQNIMAGAKAGLEEYNMNLTAIRTIMAGTGRSVEDVNKVLSELNDYSDATVYSFSDMIASMTPFTNAGVSLEKTAAAIKGVSSATALAGGDASAARIAMQNFGDAMGAGFMSLMDWRSISRVAKIGTVEFKQTMIDAAVAAGTLKKAGDGVYETLKGNTVTVTDFESALKDQWMTTETITGALGRYADANDELGAKALKAAQDVTSFAMLIDTLGEQTGSGWTKTWQTILGTPEEAVALYTPWAERLGDIVQASADARNAQLDMWRSMEGRENIIKALDNAWEALWKILGPVKEAWSEVFPPSWGTTLGKISKALADFTEGLIISDDAAATLKTAAKGLFSIIKMGVTIVSTIARVFFNAVGIVWKLASAILGLIAPIGTFLVNLLPVSDGAKSASDGINFLGDALIWFQNFLTGGLIGALKDAGNNFNNFLNGGAVQENIKRVVGWLKDLWATLTMIYNVLTKGDFTSNPWFQEDSGFVAFLFKVRDALVYLGGAFTKLKDGFIPFIQNLMARLREVLGGLGDGLKDGMKDVNWDEVLAWLNTGLIAAIAVIIGKGIKDIKKVFEATVGFLEMFKGGISDALGAFTGVLEGMQKKLKAEALLKIAIAIGVLAVALAVLATVDPGRLASASVGMGVAVGALVAAMVAMDKITGTKGAAKMPLIAASLQLMSGAMLMLAASVKIFSSIAPDRLASSMIAMVVSLGALTLAAQALAEIKNLGKTAASLILISYAIMILSTAVLALAFVPMENLAQGMVAVALMLGMMVGTAVLLSKYAPSMALSALGLMAMAAALNMLLIPVVTLGLLPMDVLTQGLLTMAILLGGLALVATLLAGQAVGVLAASVAMMAMAFAINLLVAPLILLGMLDMNVLIQGILALAAVMAILVIAALAMSGAVVGAAGMILMAGAILILSFAIATMGQLSMEQIITALIGLAGAFLILFAAAIVAAALAPGLLILAGVMLAMSIALAITALALMLMAPALILATGALLAFAAVAPKIAEATLPMMAIGAGLLVLGVGALIAGAGIMVLGAAILLLGVALALIAVVGIAGVTALKAVGDKIAEMVWIAPQLGIMAGTFLALGAAVAVMGAGMLIAGAGALMLAVGLTLLMPAGMMATLAINLIAVAIDRMSKLGPGIAVLSAALTKLAKPVGSLGTTGTMAAMGIALLAASLIGISPAALMAGLAMTLLGVTVKTTIAGMNIQLTLSTLAFKLFVAAVALSMGKLSKDINSNSKLVVLAAGLMVAALRGKLIGDIKKMRVSVQSEAQQIGAYFTRGMARGIQNGSSSVSAAARSVARTALNAAKSELDIHSPSRETEEIGDNYILGFVNKLYSSLGSVDKAGKAVGSSAMKSLKDALANASDSAMSEFDMNPTIRPVVDLSNAARSAAELNRLMAQSSVSVDSSYNSAVAAKQAYAQNQQAQSADRELVGANNVTYIQNNNSPKALSTAEIYRQTKNQISKTKGALSK